MKKKLLLSLTLITVPILTLSTTSCLFSIPKEVLKAQELATQNYIYNFDYAKNYPNATTNEIKFATQLVQNAKILTLRDRYKKASLRINKDFDKTILNTLELEQAKNVIINIFKHTPLAFNVIKSIDQFIVDKMNSNEINGERIMSKERSILVDSTDLPFDLIGDYYQKEFNKILEKNNHSFEKSYPQIIKALVNWGVNFNTQNDLQGKKGIYELFNSVYATQNLADITQHSPTEDTLFFKEILDLDKDQELIKEFVKDPVIFKMKHSDLFNPNWSDEINKNWGKLINRKSRRENILRALDSLLFFNNLQKNVKTNITPGIHFDTQTKQNTLTFIYEVNEGNGWKYYNVFEDILRIKEDENAKVLPTNKFVENFWIFPPSFEANQDTKFDLVNGLSYSYDKIVNIDAANSSYITFEQLKMLFKHLSASSDYYQQIFAKQWQIEAQKMENNLQKQEN